MRILTAIAVSGLLALMASPSRAQNFVLYPATESGYDQTCNFVESGEGGICRVVVVLNLAPTQVLGARFGVIQEDINWTPLYVSSDFPANLGSFNDFQVGFGVCLSTPVVVATLHYMCPGGSPCGQIELASSSAHDCLANESTGWGGTLTVNGIYDVPPGGFDPDCSCPALGTEPATWGRVKALYRD